LEHKLILETDVDAETPFRVRLEVLLRDEMPLSRFRILKRKAVREYLIAEFLPQSETLNGTREPRLHLLAHYNRGSSIYLIKESLSQSCDQMELCAFQ
jgi:hypothetical protein